MKQYINGELVEGKGSVNDVYDPATGEIIESFKGTTREQTLEALAAADETLKVWSKTPVNERAEWLYKLKAACTAERDKLIDLVSFESGRPYAAACGDVDWPLISLSYYAEQAKRIEGTVLPYQGSGDNPNYQIVTRQPIGVTVDRHHHGNRFGCGAHSTYHMTTRDFIHWENYGEIYPIQNSWESFGTGTMFFWNGKYYYSHGFHTDRVIPRDKVGSRLLEKNYEREGFFSAVTYDELKENGLYPSGANYMVSDDGIHFTQGKKQIHCSENPSIYKDENGGLVMYAGYGAAGVWRAPDIDGPWKKEDTDMPVFDNSSPVRNSSECPSIFEWNGYKYIIMGFTGFWQSGLNNNEFKDLAAIGDDIYDGLGVPMVADCGGRHILAGWVRGIGWASVTQHRELIQRKDGRLGIRWLPELTPNPDMLEKAAVLKTVKSGTELAMNSRTSYYLECTVTPEKNARVETVLTGCGAPCAIELFTEKQKVQITKAVNTDEFQPEIKALYEYIPELPRERTNYQQIPSEDIHMYGHDFAIANVGEIKEKYVLKIIIHYEKKSDNTVIDAEIGGGRTIISNRIYFKANKIKILSENAEITDLKLCKMGE